MFVTATSAACAPAPAGPAPAAGPDETFRARVNAFVDEWQQDAAQARPAFFDKIASDGIYIGTDKTERWTKEASRMGEAGLRPPHGVGLHAPHRNIRFTPDRQLIWLTSRSARRWGFCKPRAWSPTAAVSKIVHYQLSIAVPNDVIPQVTGAIKAFESK